MTTLTPSDFIYPDEMPDIRAWLRQHPYLTALTAGRVFFRIPPGVKQAPFLRIYQSGGGPQANSEAPLSDIRLGIEVWGLSTNDYPIVRRTSAAIQALAHDLDPGIIMGKRTRVHNINVTTALDSPDPDRGWPRRVIDSVWTTSL